MSVTRLLRTIIMVKIDFPCGVNSNNQSAKQTNETSFTHTKFKAENAWILFVFLMIPRIVFSYSEGFVLLRNKVCVCVCEDIS